MKTKDVSPIELQVAENGIIAKIVCPVHNMTTHSKNEIFVFNEMNDLINFLSSYFEENDND